jgi:CubicO group peptidase (beta-lactamase class C family)
MKRAVFGKTHWGIFALVLAFAVTGCSESDTAVETADSVAQSLSQEAVVLVGCDAEFQPVADRVEGIVNRLRLRGAGLLIVQDGQTRCRQFFGNYDEETTVHLVSAAKWLSAATIMTLVDEGILSLDEPISSFLPYYSGDRESTTIRQLLSHTAGLPMYHDCMFQHSLTLDSCARQIASMPLDAAPGTEFRYSGTSYSVAGRVAEVVADKAWLLIFQEKMATPLGLIQTNYGPTRNPILSEGYVVSTLDEYGIFLQMLMDGGVSQSGEQILSAAAITELHGDQTANVAITFSPGGPNTSYGLGVWRSGFDEDGFAQRIASPGGGGFTPWIDFERNIFGIFMIEDRIERVWEDVGAIRQKVAEIVDELNLGD